MPTMKKMVPYSLMLGAVLTAATALAPAAQAADVNVRVLLPNGQYLRVGDAPGNRWYDRPAYRNYGFSRYRFDRRRNAYVAYDPRGNYYGHNNHGGGWHDHGPHGGHDFHGHDHR